MSETAVFGKATAYLVGFNFDTHGKVTLAIIGQRGPRGLTEVVNALDGEDAVNLYKILTEKKGAANGTQSE